MAHSGTPDRNLLLICSFWSYTLIFVAYQSGQPPLVCNTWPVSFGTLLRRHVSLLLVRMEDHDAPLDT